MLNNVLVAPATTSIRDIPTCIPVGRPEGLRKSSVASFDNFAAVPKSVLKRKLGALAAGGHRQIYEPAQYPVRLNPAPGGARLRFSHISRVEQPDDWTSAHEGAMHLGMGCAQGIRNPQAHPSAEIGEQESLEQLAALSVLARWVDTCEVVNAADGTAGE